MVKHLILSGILALGITTGVIAQQEAVTRDGKVVILNDNGTWQYLKKPNQNTMQEAIAPTTTSEPIEIKNIQLSEKTFLEGPSTKLKKYFKEKNKIRCNFLLEGKEGKALLVMKWRVQTPEGFSYFGFIKKGKSLDLHLQNGQIISLIFTQEAEPKEFTKYGFSSYQTSLELTTSQIHQLKSSVVVKTIMNWSRRSEEYKIQDPSYFIAELPKLIKG